MLKKERKTKNEATYIRLLCASALIITDKYALLFTVCFLLLLLLILSFFIIKYLASLPFLS